MTGRSVEDVAARYRCFADVEAAGVSPGYEELARAVAEDAEVLAFLAALPVAKQQPNLLLAALQYLGGPVGDAAELRHRVLADADRLRETMLARATQTNEPARCAALLPLIGRFPQPLHLIEVGASAGLCLHLDRYEYSYGGVRVGGPSSVRIDCAVSGPVPVPADVPTVATRTGIDLAPLDPADPDDRAWLRALVWPGQHDRLSRLDAALDLAAAAPARMVTGHLLDELPRAVAAVGATGTTVVLSSAVLPYLTADERSAFTSLVAELPVRWVSQEGRDVLPAVRDRLPAEERRDGPGAAAERLLALDGDPVAWTAPHGGRLRWLAGR